MTSNSLSGQGSIEYLVIFAAVLVVTLIVAALLGFFPSFSGDINASQSISYWQSARPLAVIDAAQTSTDTATVIVQNSGSKEITVRQMILGPCVNGTGVVLSPGQQVLINCYNNASLTACSGRGGKYNSYALNFSYSDATSSGRLQVGSQPLAVLCK